MGPAPTSSSSRWGGAPPAVPAGDVKQLLAEAQRAIEAARVAGAGDAHATRGSAGSGSTAADPWGGTGSPGSGGATGLRLVQAYQAVAGAATPPLAGSSSGEGQRQHSGGLLAGGGGGGTADELASRMAGLDTALAALQSAPDPH